MKNIEYILNDCLNKAMCQKGRIQQPDSNKIAEFVSKYVEAKKLNLHAVVASLPTTNEAKLKLKRAVENSFKDNEVVEKREYSLGFRHCYNWLKIEQMKSKG